MTRRIDPLPILILCAALGLRLFGIETQSIWADEGGTLALASRDPARILAETLADVHPPLYYWMLHGWMGLFGTSVASARGLSAVCGALTVLVTILLARRWYGPTAGIVAGVAACVSPLAIHYSQEARMYAPAMLLAAMLFLALDRWLERPRAGRLAIAVLCGAALLLTHYFAVTIAAAAMTAAFVRSVRRVPANQRETGRGRLARLGLDRATLLLIAAQIPLAILYLLPVLASRSRLAGWTAAKEATPPGYVLLDSLHTLSVGLSAPPEWGWWSALFAVFALIGMIFGRPRITGARLSVICWLGIPILAMVLLSLDQPYYKPRFLLPALPALHLLVGAGAAVLVERSITARADSPTFLRSVLTALVCLGLLIAASIPLYREWFDPAVWRDEYRGAARDVAATVGPDDVLVLNGQSQIDTINYYLRTPQPRVLLPRVRPLDPAAVEAELAGLASQYRRIYGLFYVIEEADPQGVIAGWLDTHAFPSGARWYGTLLLRTWETGDLSDRLQPSKAAFAGWLRAEKFAVDQGIFRAGDGIRAQIAWNAATAPERPYNLFLHLVDAGGRLVAQYDGPLGPAGAGMEWTNRAAIIIPPDTPPGDYRLLLGVYEPAGGTRLTLEDGNDTLMLTALTIR